VLEADTQPSEEPTEVVTKDEDAPVVATTKEGESSATPADPSAKPDVRTDVDGVGAFTDGSNEEASKPDVKTEADGKGGITDASNEEASKPDSTEDLGSDSSDNAGFNKDKTTDDSGPTKTFDDNSTNAVTDTAYPSSGGVTGAAVEAAKPGTAKPQKTPGVDVEADARVDVEDSENFDNPQKGTDQWTGTGGNGVTKQQPPVTPKVGPGNDVKSSRIFQAVRLADTEISVGITNEADKYNRIAEIAEYSPEEFKAAATVVARVKKAGLSKRVARQATSIPSLQQAPKPAEPVEKTASVEADEAIFLS
jgi:hypothetical protein